MTVLRLPARFGLLVVLAASAGAPASIAGVRGDDPPTLNVKSAVVNATWKQGWLVPGAAIRVAGRVTAPSKLTVILRPVDRPSVVTARLAVPVAAAGPFAANVKLPARPLPGDSVLRAPNSGSGL